MASPQKENGYVAIANEIAEALAQIRISGDEYRILWVVLRKTWGWNKKEDLISLSQFVLATGIKKPNIIRALKGLEAKNVVIKKDNGTIVKYTFNKDFDTWKPLSKKIMIIKNDNAVIKKDNKSLSKMIPTIPSIKPTNTKDIITKVIKEKMGIITEQDEVTGEIRPIMRMNSYGVLEPSVYGNREIGLAMYYFEEHLGGKTDGKPVTEKRYAMHLTRALKKEYPDQDPVELVKWLLKGALVDPWIAKNCTSFQWLFYNKQKVIQAVKGLKKKEPKGIKIS